MFEPRTSYLKGIDIAAAGILVIGGLNWGVIGIFGFNPIESVFGMMSAFSRILYSLVGISALYEVVQWRAIQRRWECRPWPETAQRIGV